MMRLTFIIRDYDGHATIFACVFNGEQRAKGIEIMNDTTCVVACLGAGRIVEFIEVIDFCSTVDSAALYGEGPTYERINYEVHSSKMGCARRPSVVS